MLQVINQDFPKSERIYLREDITGLFKEGKQEFVYPFKIFICHKDVPSSTCPARILISIPAKKYKKAVTRNKLKRLVRESYRKHKAYLWNSVPEGKQLHVAFVFVGDANIDLHSMEDRMIRALETLKTKLIKF